MNAEITVVPGRSLAELTALYFGDAKRVDTFFFGEPADRPHGGFDAVLRAVVSDRFGDLPAQVAHDAGAGMLPLLIIKWGMRMRCDTGCETVSRVLQYRKLTASEFRFLGVSQHEAEILQEELRTRLDIRYSGEPIIEAETERLHSVICPLRKGDQLVEVCFGLEPIIAAHAAAAA